MNPIPANQATAEALERLAAQRQLYADAKAIQGIQFVLGAPLAVLWALVVTLVPDLRAVAAATGVFVLVLNEAVLTPRQKEKQRTAAKIQELFDCGVLELEWDSLRAGHPPDPETVLDAADRYRKNAAGYRQLVDDPWYPASVGRLPLELARLVCQRTNCWWDAQQRRRYADAVLAVILLLAIITVMIGVLGKFTVSEIVLGVALPLTPGTVFAIRQYREHRDAAANLDRLREHAERVWAKAMGGAATKEDLTRESRALQNELHEHRRRNPPVFSWFYDLFRRGNELTMNKGAETLVEEARLATPPR